MVASRNYGNSVWGSSGPKIPHLIQGGGLPAEVKDIRSDITTMVAGQPCLVAEEFIDTEPGTTNAIKTSIAVSTSVASYSGVALNGAVGGTALSVPRKVTVSTSGSTPADAPATLTVTGLDKDGVEQTEDIAVSQTVATATGTLFFSQITQLDLTAGQGTDAALVFGLSSELLLRRTPVSRAGLAKAVFEIANGALVTTGTLSVANKSYTPAAAPDASKDYFIIYEAEPLILPSVVALLLGSATEVSGPVLFPPEGDVQIGTGEGVLFEHVFGGECLVVAGGYPRGFLLRWKGAALLGQVQGGGQMELLELSGRQLFYLLQAGDEDHEQAEGLIVVPTWVLLRVQVERGCVTTQCLEEQAHLSRRRLFLEASKLEEWLGRDASQVLLRRLNRGDALRDELRQVRS